MTDPQPPTDTTGDPAELALVIDIHRSLEHAAKGIIELYGGPSLAARSLFVTSAGNCYDALRILTHAETQLGVPYTAPGLELAHDRTHQP